MRRCRRAFGQFFMDTPRTGQSRGRGGRQLGGPHPARSRGTRARSAHARNARARSRTCPSTTPCISPADCRRSLRGGSCRPDMTRSCGQNPQAAGGPPSPSWLWCWQQSLARCSWLLQPAPLQPAPLHLAPLHLAPLQPCRFNRAASPTGLAPATHFLQAHTKGAGRARFVFRKTWARPGASASLFARFALFLPFMTKRVCCAKFFFA